MRERLLGIASCATAVEQFGLPLKIYQILTRFQRTRKDAKSRIGNLGKSPVAGERRKYVMIWFVNPISIYDLD